MTKKTKRCIWFLLLSVLLPAVVALAACGVVRLPQHPARGGSVDSADRSSGGSTIPVRVARPGNQSLPAPKKLSPFAGTPAFASAGRWRPAGRRVSGKAAVYETLLVPPGGTMRAGIAWMNTPLLSARLYSGSLSPGGSGYRYSAPVAPGAARSLVAAFNGGFKMADAHGGYYTEGRAVRPLAAGSASLVIYANGSATVGAWGSDVTMTASVASVRQNLFPLVIDGKPSARAYTRTWRVWGGTCPCGTGLHGWKSQWRSGLGVTADGALVYAAGPQLDPVQLAGLLVRAGVVRGMELDINPSWPVFASYQPAAANGLAGPSNGTSLIKSYRGPATFFEPTYARDFITMSAASAPAG